MELALYANTLTQDYDIWRKQRVNSQQVSSTNYTFQNPFSEEMPFLFVKEKAKKEEEKAAQTVIELRKKSVKYKTVSTELMTSRSERQELRERIRNLEDTLQAHKKQLDTLLEALEEKNGQYDRDTRAYERALHEENENLSYLINEIRKVAMHVVQLSDEVEDLSCQFPPNQISSISEFL
ncbi:hypothetical protein J1N35_044544 [Gossypium stocksii]|uniref:Uncharacterized protein n=1 Tax=Gossypium stocksii TaxID=47602 RepID=A0A9D3U9K7_9ROSI|nr:hypothetical protein J1N35_044544 [Gossypium stocksii]